MVNERAVDQADTMYCPSRHSSWTAESSPGSSCVFIAESSSAAETPPASLPRKTCFETFQSAVNKHRNILIVSVISHIIFIIIIFILVVCLIYYQGRSVPSNHQKDAINCLPVPCPPDWIAHQGHCYKLSHEEKNWEESQNYCILHNASLAKITQEEKDFVTMLTRNHVFWIGLKSKPDQPWKWLDGEHSTLEVMGNGGDCAYLDDDATASSGRCTIEHRYICKKNDPKRS
ncbi:C-type lectin domain family 2 member D-like isoform X2 [Ahaetulla prasina]|uniref:C-type lectin domain family 2 member D-like isoform X2 n=2 Tax=Ahaetulla prasina TaxID=499056 RepID=UPI002649218B|nr:C-type lectin domain family 2 member D-like isoform X2 [Ahaetulla prasina]XP_058026066.1 C-type lectin domain family 2 member D-like isoform X2 [Ahaetulla prasina]